MKKPGATRDRIVGILGDALKITTSAPAERGKANQAIAAILAEELGVGRSDVRLVSGAASPRKELRTSGLSADEMRRRLARL